MEYAARVESDEFFQYVGAGRPTYGMLEEDQVSEDNVSGRGHREGGACFEFIVAVQSWGMKG